MLYLMDFKNIFYKKLVTNDTDRKLYKVECIKCTYADWSTMQTAEVLH